MRARENETEIKRTNGNETEWVGKEWNTKNGNKNTLKGKTEKS